jgi:hypothetical protein
MSLFSAKVSNDNPAATRFQRVSIAAFCTIAVLLETPIPVYLVLASAVLAFFFSTRFELFVLFYKNVLKKILGRELFTFTHISPGAFLLDFEAERFIFLGMGICLGCGVALYHAGITWWYVPVAVVATFMTLSATAGICLMAFVYAGWKKYKMKRDQDGTVH